MKIINFGSINIDYVYEMDHFVREKETTSSLSFSKHIGGKGLNQSIACKKAGIDVIHAGMIGEDGKFILKYLQENNIDTKYIKCISKPTGHAIIQNCRGENSIIIEHGANYAIDNEYIDFILNKCNKDNIILIQNEISNIDYLIKKAYEKEIPIYFNVAPCDKTVLEYPLNLVSTLIVNEIEAQELTNCSSNNYEDILDCLEKKFINQEILLTVGRDGAFYSNNKKRIYQKAYSVTAIDSTAAGDTFIGFFISSIIKGYEVKDALNIASKASSVTIQKKGASNSIPSWSDII